MASTKQKKFIFIDTNLYRSLFVSEGFAKEILPILKKLLEGGFKILLPKQVIDEINRNRYAKWIDEDFSPRIRRLQNILNSLKNDEIKKFSGAKQLIHSIERESIRLEKDNKKLAKSLTSPKGKSSKLIKKLIGLATIIHDSSQITVATQKRIIKNNPPFNKGGVDEKNCDRYIWESLLWYFQSEKINNPTLYLFTKDVNDWCVNDGVKSFFHPFLTHEFQDLTSGKLIWSDNLQNLPTISRSEKKLVGNEERKISNDIRFKIIRSKIGSKLRESNSWNETDRLIRLSVPYIDQFDAETILEIIRAARDNVYISAGPYNQVLDASKAYDFFAKLYARSQVVGIPSGVWKQLYIDMDEKQQERYLYLRRSLEAEGVKFSINELKHILPEDIPF